MSGVNHRRQSVPRTMTDSYNGLIVVNIALYELTSVMCCFSMSLEIQT